MVSRATTIKDPKGLHLRTATIFSGEALKFKCSVKIRSGNATLNAKSVLGVLGTCAKYGDEVEIICSGEDEEKAAETLIEILRSLNIEE
ncbi:MAG: HPr family phosphocarrier protein [Acetivibrio ethanolgignens]